MKNIILIIMLYMITVLYADYNKYILKLDTYIDMKNFEEAKNLIKKINLNLFWFIL